MLSTDDLRYTLTRPTGESWRTDPALTGLAVPDPANVHEAHLGTGRGDVATLLLDKVGGLVQRDVQSDQPVRAAHRRVGPRDVYLVMGASQGSACSFRATGRAELWDPWTGQVRPLRVLARDAGRTTVRMPLEAYEAQIIVFTPGESPPVVSAASPTEIAKSPEPLVLDGDWEFELKPTMDNRWGDFRLPVTEPMIGAEARIFRYAEERAANPGWQTKEFDDSRWPRVTHGFGQKFWKLGPLPKDLDTAAADATLAAIQAVDPAAPVEIGGKPTLGHRTPSRGGGASKATPGTRAGTASRKTCRTTSFAWASPRAGTMKRCMLRSKRGRAITCGQPPSRPRRPKRRSSVAASCDRRQSI